MALTEEIKRELDAVSADNGLRSKCLGPMDSLLEQARNLESIAHLNQAEQEAVRALDLAFEKIEASVQAPALKDQTASEPPVERPKAFIKPRRIVKPAELVSTAYLET